MSENKRRQPWHLVQTASFHDSMARLSPKHQVQIARKIVDLTHDPRPGGSKTALVAYDGLYRIRAGEYRIIYRFNDAVVQLLTLSRRDESTYDELDVFEIEEFREFEATGPRRAKPHLIPDWEKLAVEWATPKPKPETPLPEPITGGILEKLDIPVGYRPSLLAVKTVEALENCDEVPSDYRCRIIDHLWRKKDERSLTEVIPVVTKADLVEPVAEREAGPLDPPMLHVESVPEETMTPADSRSSRKRPLPAVIKPKPLVIRSSRMESPLRPYPGNIAKGIAKDTRYTAKLDGTIQLRFSLDDREWVLLTTDQHPELIEIVREAKRFGSGSDAGGFVINEFRHVLVPTEKGILFAGRYYRDLEFEFEGNLITPVAPGTIKHGSVWPGPHVGVRYTLAAGASDVRYVEHTKRNTEREVRLSDFHSKEELSELLAMFRAVKRNGGAVYVNEARELFAPVDAGSGYQRVYIGHLGALPWFPEPA